MASTSPGPIVTGEDAPIFHVMRTMRAMRKLKPDPVPDELLTQLVEAATWAPSGSNSQGYHYVVVTDREQIAKVAELWRVVSGYYLEGIARAVPPGSTEEKHEKLRAALRYQRDHFEETPALIVACYDMGPYVQRLRAQAKHIASATAHLGPRRAASVLRSTRRFTELGEAASIYPGVQNLLLAARALGLGATITTWHHMIEGEFKAALGIPAKINTYAVVPIGWPVGNLGPTARLPVQEVIHRDRW
jgi:nitroreductase